MEKLKSKELASLIQSVFSPKPSDKALAVLVDVPDEVVPDQEAWTTRRSLAYGWIKELETVKSSIGLETVSLIAYPNVHSNNADLPEIAYLIEESPETLTADDLADRGKAKPFSEILASHQLILSPTQFSTTAPLKLLAKQHKFRAATMPGFSSPMIPALRLDYEEINRRVNAVKDLLDPSIGLKIRFTVDKDQSCDIQFDLRHRPAHASGGRFPDPGTAGNLPSGECYIVPYEGEKKETSESQGILPVQFDNEVVIYQIEANKAVDVLSEGTQSAIEKQKIIDEPAYANIAELGFGVLKDFGMKPTGVILLDEKLGLHIAFGRSDHFGGAIGVKDFSSPEKVIHIDRIYIPEIMNRITVEFVDILNADGRRQNLMSGGMYTIFI